MRFVIIICSILIISGCSSSVKTNNQTYHTVERHTTEDISIPEHTTIPVAMFVPLTGQHQPIGQAMYDAARLALESTPNHHVKLIAWDTQGKPDVAARAMEEAAQKKVHIIIGPLFSKTTHAISAQAEDTKTPVLAFTNDSSIAKKGIYSLGFNPTQQMNNMVNYATSRHVQQFAALLPANYFGKTLAAQLKNAVSGHQGRLVHTEFYGKSPEELQVAIKNVHEALTTASLQESADPEAVKTVLVMADQDDRIKQLAEEMTTQRVNLKDLQCQMALTGQRECDLAVEQPLLRASLLAGGDPSRIQRFKTAFQKRFGYEAPTMASLAYDVTALIASQLTPDDAEFIHQKLLSSRGFDGINGLFRLLPNGQTERYFNIIELNPDYQKLLEGTPNQF